MSQSRCQVQGSTNFTDLSCPLVHRKLRARCAMAGVEAGELATPLVSFQPAGASPQQVMSPTLGQGYGTTAIPSPPPGRDGIHSGPTPPLENAHSGAEGFEPRAAGRAFEGAGQRESLQDSGEAPQMSTTMDGGVGAHHSVPVPGITPGESSGQGYRPTLAGQVQVPSMAVGTVKLCQGE